MSPEPLEAIRRRLENLGGPLFALLDAARDPAVLDTIREGGRPHRTLYEGDQAVDLADFGPILVDLGGGGDPLRRLIERGWGRSWGVYLASRADFEAIRGHYRRYLTVEIPGGTSALFRFYDPRVLRQFLASWNPEELSSFFGPASCLAIEAAADGIDAGLREYRPSTGGERSDRPRWLE